MKFTCERLLPMQSSSVMLVVTNAFDVVERGSLMAFIALIHQSLFLPCYFLRQHGEVFHIMAGRPPDGIGCTTPTAPMDVERQEWSIAKSHGRKRNSAQIIHCVCLWCCGNWHNQGWLLCRIQAGVLPAKQDWWRSAKQVPSYPLFLPPSLPALHGTQSP